MATFGELPLPQTILAGAGAVLCTSAIPLHVIAGICLIGACVVNWFVKANFTRRQRAPLESNQ
jgi:hypothetical protein